MSDTNSPQVPEPILTPPPIQNHIPYVLQRLKEVYDRINNDDTYVPLLSQNNTASQEDTETAITIFKRAFQQALETLVQYNVFVVARQEEWVHKFERMRQIAAQCPQQEYYDNIVQTAECAFMDVLEWIRTSEAESAEYARTYTVLFNID